MFDRFTDRARKTMGYSRQKAQRYNHDYIGTEHILLGLLDEGNGIGVAALRELGVDLGRLPEEIERGMTLGTTMVTMAQLPFTPAARKMLELALEEANNFEHGYIGSEHLLLGLIHEKKGIAGAALKTCGVKLEPVREAILRVLAHQEPSAVQKQSAFLHRNPANESLSDEVENLRERVRALEERVNRLRGE